MESWEKSAGRRKEEQEGRFGKDEGSEGKSKKTKTRTQTSTGEEDEAKREKTIRTNELNERIPTGNSTGR